LFQPRQTYAEAIEFLLGRINFERAPAGSYTFREFKLDRMRQLLERIGNPQERIPVVHVAGTKGKGSTTTMISAILSAAGYGTGTFTSPHLDKFEERLAVDGQHPTEADIVRLVNQVGPATAELEQLGEGMGPTFFELTTALGWLWFEERKVDLAVLEVGMGGRLDSTNLCRPLVTVITNVSRDHTAFLGETLPQITREKAGIFKRGVPALTSAIHPEVLSTLTAAADAAGVPLRKLGSDWSWEAATHGQKIRVKTWGREFVDIPVPLPGEHQRVNASLAIAVVETLSEQGWRIDEESIIRGMSGVHGPARIEVLGHAPLRIVDGGHNWESIKALVATLRQPGQLSCGPADLAPRRKILIFAAARDKDYHGMLRQLVPEFDTVIITQYLRNARAVPVAELSRTLEDTTTRPFHVVASPAAAWRLASALASPADLVCSTGSFFLAAEMRELMRPESATLPPSIEQRPALTP